MWAYPEGMSNWDSIWPEHGIRVEPQAGWAWDDADGPESVGVTGVCNLRSRVRWGEDFAQSLAGFGRRRKR